LRVIKAYSDGSCKNTSEGKEPMGCGVYIEDKNKEVVSKSISIDSLGNSNTSEYHGLLNAIKEVRKYCEESFLVEYKVIFHVDSRFVCDDFNSMTWGQRGKKYRSIKEQCEEEISHLHKAVVKWVPRTQNKKADKLAGQGRKNAIKNGLI